MIPLVWHGVTIGLVEVVDEADRVFTPGEVELCGDLARLVASAVYNAIAFERTRESSVRDPATGLHNRRFSTRSCRWSWPGLAARVRPSRSSCSTSTA